MSEECTGDYVKWIWTVFGECVVTPRDQASFYIGLLSTLIWMYAQIPQCIMNFKLKKVYGLSFYFLLALLTGDICNLTGCLITNGLITQIITASFFCCIDGFCTLQYIYYQWIRPKLSCFKNPDDPDFLLIPNSDTVSVEPSGLILVGAAAIATTYPDPYKPPNLIGSLIGWVSGFVYSSSRVMQLIKNFKRKQTDGLSPQFFVSAWLGNCTYAISIFIKDSSWGNLWLKFPWLVGSIGPMILDICVLIQFFIYRKNTLNATEYEKVN